MSKSTTVTKPRPDFPLFPHATGRWAKKVRGKLCYFGKTADDPKGEAALTLWTAQKDDLLAGRKPRTPGEYLTVADLCNQFLSAKRTRADTGEISARSWGDYYATCDSVVTEFGRNRAVEDLRQMISPNSAHRSRNGTGLCGSAMKFSGSGRC